MLNKAITYTDFTDTQHTETFYFNISKRELFDMQLMSDGTIQSHLEAIVKSNQASVILPEFKKLLKIAYGVRSADGKRFIKTDEVWEEFTHHAAFDELLFELYTKPDEAAKFFSQLVPKDLEKEVQQMHSAPRATDDTSELARERSEAQMQGFNRPRAEEGYGRPQEPSVQVATGPESTPADLGFSQQVTGTQQDQFGNTHTTTETSSPVNVEFQQSPTQQSPQQAEYQAFLEWQARQGQQRSN